MGYRNNYRRDFRRDFDRSRRFDNRTNDRFGNDNREYRPRRRFISQDADGFRGLNPQEIRNPYVPEQYKGTHTILAASPSNGTTPAKFFCSQCGIIENLQHKTVKK